LDGRPTAFASLVAELLHPLSRLIIHTQAEVNCPPVATVQIVAGVFAETLTLTACTQMSIDPIYSGSTVMADDREYNSL
jgi:hypothetical protein